MRRYKNNLISDLIKRGSSNKLWGDWVRSSIDIILGKKPVKGGSPANDRNPNMTHTLLILFILFVIICDKYNILVIDREIISVRVISE